MTKRAAAAGAHSLNEPDLPERTGDDARGATRGTRGDHRLSRVDKASHARYRPRDGATFCNIYAHDYCHLAGVYLPRVWWTPDAIERLAQGETVEPRLESTIDEQRANNLFRWLRAFGPRFGWRQTGTLTKLQTEVKHRRRRPHRARRKWTASRDTSRWSCRRPASIRRGANAMGK